MTVGALKSHMQGDWDRIKEELLKGEYQPSPVRVVDIPKPGKRETRMLGIPTVVDRMIQQALHQVLSLVFEPHFSQSSYGFRPGRSAHQAISKARQYVAEGRKWVVDIDLEKFFDKVNHDMLMSRVARKVEDKRILRLIRRYLQAGLMVDGVSSPRKEGTPQGGPLSPLLSNVLLDDLDKELEERGHVFCRYADDCNIYVRSCKAGERVMATVTRFLEERLKLKVNRDKSAVAHPWERTFLGYSMTRNQCPKLKPAEESVKRLKSKLKGEFRRGRGRNAGNLIRDLNKTLRGWVNYFQLSNVKEIFKILDGWIRRKLRSIIWRQKKTPKARAKALMQQGIATETSWKCAWSGKGPWRTSRSHPVSAAFSKRYFEKCGLISLLNQMQKWS